MLPPPSSSGCIWNLLCPFLSADLLHVFFSRSLFLCLCGACLATLSLLLLSACSSQFHFLVLSWVSMDSWSICLHDSVRLVFLSKTCGNVKMFLTSRLIKEFTTKNRKRLTFDDFLRKLWTTGSIERTAMIHFKMCCLYVVRYLVLPGSVVTQLGWSGKFC